MYRLQLLLYNLRVIHAVKSICLLAVFFRLVVTWKDWGTVEGEIILPGGNVGRNPILDETIGRTDRL